MVIPQPEGLTEHQRELFVVDATRFDIAHNAYTILIQGAKVSPRRLPCV